MTKRRQKPPPTPLARRLATVMEEMDWSQSDLARAAGCSRQTVSSWMNGQNETMTNAIWAMNLQSRSKFNALWILTGEGAERVVEISDKEREMLAAIREAPEDRKALMRLIFPGLEI